ncbi:MAG: hemerythrin domain-containing protein [Caldimonas sp.]
MVKQPSPKHRTATPVPLHDVVGALYAEHRYVARLLDVLQEQVEAASSGRPIDRGAAIGVMSYMTEYPDAYHHPREDVMFVRLVKRDPTLSKRVSEVERAHRTIGSSGRKLLEGLQRLGEPGQLDEAGVVSRIGDYVAAMREHMRIEEHDLFPRAREVLDASDLEAIDRDFARVTDPIFEAEVREAYASYSPVVRHLVEQPSVRRAFGVLEAFYESAATLGDVIFGPEAADPGPNATARRRR